MNQVCLATLKNFVCLFLYKCHVISPGQRLLSSEQLSVAVKASNCMVESNQAVMVVLIIGWGWKAREGGGSRSGEEEDA